MIAIATQPATMTVPTQMNVRGSRAEMPLA
jgi:hypothetical protein